MGAEVMIGRTECGASEIPIARGLLTRFDHAQGN